VRHVNRASLGLTVITILIGLGFWLTAGVSGEVFLLSPDGKTESAPGAQVRIYRCDNKHSLAAFLAGQMDLQHSWNELDAKVPQFSPETLLLSPELSNQRLHTIQTFMYMDVFTKISKYWRTMVTQTTTDRNGHFTVRLAPGKYVIHVSGQAGRKEAHWLTEVQVVWRSETRLSTPIYAYEPE
jgi:hypothetical protein